MGVNPCCGVKLKTAVMVIAIVDVVYGVVCLVCGIVVIAVGVEKRLSEIYASPGLEGFNMLLRPVLKIAGGIILLFSARLAIRCNGIPSVGGCIVWTLIQLLLFVITILRFLQILKSPDTYFITRSGLGKVETTAVLISLAPFASVFVLWYEITCVSFYIFKIVQDRVLLKPAEDVAMQKLVEVQESPTRVDGDENGFTVAGSSRDDAKFRADPRVSTMTYGTKAMDGSRRTGGDEATAMADPRRTATKAPTSVSLTTSLSSPLLLVKTGT